MPRKTPRPKTITFGLDKKIRDDAGNDIGEIVLEKDTQLEFTIEFAGPELALWLVDSAGQYSLVFSSAADGLPPASKIVDVVKGSYTLDSNSMWISSLSVRVLV